LHVEHGKPAATESDSDPQADAETMSTAVSHAWSWFEVHAVQRQNYVNFFLVAIGLLSAAYVGALTGKLPYLAAAIGALGAFVALSFFSIDLRNRELIHAGERPLKELQGRLADKLALDSLRILEAVEFPRYRWTRMGRIVRTMHLVVMAAFIAACIYAIVAGK
jgi:hypothetical protein